MAFTQTAKRIVSHTIATLMAVIFFWALIVRLAHTTTVSLSDVLSGRNFGSLDRVLGLSYHLWALAFLVSIALIVGGLLLWWGKDSDDG